MPDDDMVKPMQIGEVADRTGLSFRTLRHYDEVGLLQPSARSDGGFRLYTESDVQRLLVIRRMKPLGFSLDEMGEVMRTVSALDESDGDRDALLTSIAGTIDEARLRRDKLERHLAMANEFIDMLSKRLVE